MPALHAVRWVGAEEPLSSAPLEPGENRVVQAALGVAATHAAAAAHATAASAPIGTAG